jgi:hypothetical protein
MEATITDVQEFIKFKLVDHKSLTEKFNAWFSGILMSTELPYDDITNEELDEAQKAAEALCDKVEHMVLETFDGHCDMDSIFRMLVRICDKGTKLIPNLKSEYRMEYFSEGKKSMYLNSKKLPGGYKRFKAHFRWNHTVYTLRPEYVVQLGKMVRWSNYYTINENAQLCSLYSEED